jgi:small subunit ribosomal protein S1
MPTKVKIDETEEEVKPAVKVDKNSMKALFEKLGDDILPYKEGDMVEAAVLAVGGNRIWVDVAGQALGFIPEREITTKTGLKKGDKIFASVLHMENEEGNVVLSMRQADREKYWQEMEEKCKTGEVIASHITDANKGGLISEIGGIQGFLPVSQLTAEHYPRVSGGDKEEILNRLRQFIGTDMMVKVINCDKEGNKLIFSEKAVSADEVKGKIDKYSVGDKVKGKITGIVDFGLFIKIDTQIEGLIHISEISLSRVTDLHKLFHVGDEVDAIIIGIDNGKISLSLKRLQDDPWVKAAAKFKVNTEVKGEVTKITPFGAFVSLGDGIDGLAHVSEMSDEHIVDPGQIVELGKEYTFKIISIEPDSHRLGLSLKGAGKK